MTTQMLPPPPKSDPPQVQLVNARGAIVIALIGSLVELTALVALTFLRFHDRIGDELFGMLMGGSLVGPIVGKWRGKLGVTSLGLAVGYAGTGKGALAASGIGAAARYLGLIPVSLALALMPVPGCAFWQDTGKPIVRTVNDAARIACELFAERNQGRLGMGPTEWCAIHDNLQPFVNHILQAERVAAERAGLPQQ